jgi:hypothetical protein
MRKVKLLLLENPDQEWSEGIEVEFLVDDFPCKLSEEIFFENLRCLVRPNVRIFDANVAPTVHFVRHQYQEVGVDFRDDIFCLSLRENMRIFELKPGDTATIKQEDGMEVTIRAYSDFTMVQTHATGTKLETDMGGSD